MALALLLAATFAFAELFIRLPIIASMKDAAGYASRSASVIKAEKISDHWKERVLLAYSQRLFMMTARLSGFLAIAFSPVAAALAIAAIVNAPLFGLLASLQGIAASLAAAIVYVFARKRLVGT